MQHKEISTVKSNLKFQSQPTIFSCKRKKHSKGSSLISLQEGKKEQIPAKQIRDVLAYT